MFQTLRETLHVVFGHSAVLATWHTCLLAFWPVDILLVGITYPHVRLAFYLQVNPNGLLTLKTVVRKGHGRPV